MSVLEIALKHASGKITLPDIPERWIEEQSIIWQIEFLPILKQDIYKSAELPPLHKDPFDRLLVAAAENYNLPILTPDLYIKAYSIAVIWE